MTAPLKLRIMDKVQAYAESYVSVGNYMHAKRIAKYSIAV